MADNIVSLDQYQAEAMKTAVFGPVGHPVVNDLMICFSEMGKIAERAKKTFRDNKGDFTTESKQAIVHSLESICDKGATILASMNKPVVGQGCELIYPIFGLMGESGEVAGKLIPLINNPAPLTVEQRAELVKEIGDVMWYLAALTTVLGVSLSEVATINIEKLKSRQDRGKIHGDGDNR